MDLGSVVAAFNSVKVAADITKSLVSLHTLAEVQSKAIELNGKIIEAQQAIFTAQTTQTELISRIGELEGQIAQMKNWDAEKQRYELAAPFPGCMVYALKKSMSNGQTPHYLCTSCYQNGKTSILQGKEIPSPLVRGGASYCCSVCKTEARTPWGNVQPPQYFEDIIPKS